MIVWDKVHFGMGTNFRNQHELMIFASKGNPKPSNNRGLANVISSKRVVGTHHPTEKPLDLIEKLIKTSSKENDLILDPFAGSCTTAVACKQLKRNYICIEKEEKYVKICHERLAATSNPLF